MKRPVTSNNSEKAHFFLADIPSAIVSEYVRAKTTQNISLYNIDIFLLCKPLLNVHELQGEGLRVQIGRSVLEPLTA